MAIEVAYGLTDAEGRAIRRSNELFDLAAPLTPEELALMGVPSDALIDKKVDPATTVRDIEEDQFSSSEAVDDVSLMMDGQTYNGRYLRYLRGQALVTLVGFTEGWSVFKTDVLDAYVRERRRENREYRGDDPNRAHALRLREMAAEDFVNFIKERIAEAKATPKPILKQK